MTSGLEAPADAAGPERAPAGIESVTVNGVLERLVVDRPDSHDVRYAVRTGERTWWLDGVPEPAPAPGSVVEVVGTPLDEHTLDVEALRVVRAAAGSSAAAPPSTRVLAIRVYWGPRPPAAPTAATLRQKVITDSQAWFREVSHRRYTVSGTVTNWLKISRPSDCFGDVYSIANQALAAAQRAGHRLADYGRFVFYEPCSAGGIAGLGSWPGSYIWLFGTLEKSVVMHEQGHNLGLDHASSRICTASPWGPVTWSSRCQVSEYGDEIDTMGNRRAGHYSAYFKSVLGWLQRSTTVTSTRTVRLAPFETTGPGYKAVRIPAGGGANYWVEFRSRIGFDRAMPPGTGGVQIRYQPSGKPELLDAGPGSTIGYYDFADTHLPSGSSWTTPQNVRLTVSGQSPSGATIAIRYRAGAPRAPGAPGRVTARPLVNGARISWSRPADNGSIIRRYVVRRLSDGATRTLETSGGVTTSYAWEGLSPRRTYRFSVRAVSQAGSSAATSSPAVRPATDQPSVVITNPASTGEVSGVVPIRFTARPNASTRAPIYRADVYVAGAYVGSDFDAPWGPIQWDTRALSNGRRTIRVTVYDQSGRTRSVTRVVTVRNPTPTVTITSPTAGADVAGTVPVTYTLSPAGWDWNWVELLIDGNVWASAQPGDPLSFESTYLTNGDYTLRVRAYDPRRATLSAPLAVNVENP